MSFVFRPPSSVYRRAERFFQKLKSNEVQIVAGNKQVAMSVGSGRADFGWTDTDDALEEIEKGMPVEIVYPAQQPDGIGTLFIPNTVAIVHGCPHPALAKALVDYLLSPEVESMLAAGPSAQIPLNPNVLPPRRIKTPKTIRAMKVDFEKAAEKWDAAAKFLRDEFAGG